MELGLTTFAEITDSSVSPGERLRQVVEEAKLADELGLDVYGIGEHHRPDMAASSPEIVLAAIAGGTKKLKLSSAVIVLSSADPVRTFQNFVTLDLVSNGRAELMVGRGTASSGRLWTMRRSIPAKRGARYPSGSQSEVHRIRLSGPAPLAYRWR